MTNPKKFIQIDQIITKFSNKLFSDPTVTETSTISAIQVSEKKQSSPNLQKDLIIQWFVNLDITKKQQNSYIQDQELIHLLLNFKTKSKQSKYKFSTSNKTNIKYSLIQSLQKNFKSQTALSNIPAAKIEAQNYFLDNLRIYYTQNSKILFLTKQILKNHKTFFLNLNIISDYQIFQYSDKQVKKNEISQNPLWFSKNGYNTLGEWIGSALQKSILKNYNNAKKGCKQLNFPFKEGEKLIKFFNKMEQNEKQQLILSNDFIFLEKNNIIFPQILEIKFSEVTLQILDCVQRCTSLIQKIYSQNINLDEKKKTSKKSNKTKKKNKQKQKIKQQDQKYNPHELQQNNKIRGEISKKQQIQQKQKTQVIIYKTQTVQQITQILAQPSKTQQIILQFSQIQQIQTYYNQIIQKNEIQNFEDSFKNIQHISDIQNIQNIQNSQNEKYVNKMTLIDEGTDTTDQADINYQSIFQFTNSQKSDNPISTTSLSEINQKKKYQKKRKNKKKKDTQDSHQILLNDIFDSFINTKVINFVNKISINSNKLMKYRILVFQKLRYLIKSIFQNYDSIDAKVFGSTSLGLALPTSDIDILLTGFKIQSKEDSIQILQKLSECFSNLQWIKSCNTFTSAKIPIIKMEVDPYFSFSQLLDFPGYFNPIPNQEINEKSHLNIKVDITLQTKIEGLVHIGFQSTNFMKQCLLNHCQLSQIVLILKQFLFSKNLNQAYRGGINSYGLYLMVASYLKQFDINNKSQEEHKQIGKLLYEILEFYCFEFDNESIGISYYYDKPCFFKATARKESLHIIQPISGNILTANCTKFQQIITQFKIIYNSMDKVKEQIRKILAQLNSEEIKSLIHKKKNPEKWIKQYQHELNLCIPTFTV